MRILIKGGTVVDAAQNIEQKADVYMEDGVILEIGENLDYDGYETDVIDASGKIVAAGLVDMHCHLREPGFEYKEDIESGAKSAVMGGFTSIACMPNTNPPIDNRALAQFVLARGAQVGAAKVYPIGAISKGMAGEELAEIGEMKFAGVVGVSDDGKPVANAGLMRRALQYAAMFDVAVISHCEELSLLDGGSMNEGAVATSMGLRGISPAVEEVMVSRDILLAKAENVPVHIAHVSTRGSVQMVRDAKKQGVKVTCETCPHYFTLTEDAACGLTPTRK